MKYFEFSKNVIPRVIKELEKAEKFIHIAIFQLHRDDIFDILLKKLKENVEIELFTLPYDSIHGESQLIIERFEQLKDLGAKIHFCKWNVGDPSRTTTAVGKWYSFHGKFIVTEKSALSISANFTQSDELDAILIYENDSEKVEEYNKKFNFLKDLFVIKKQKYDGRLYEDVINLKLDNLEEIFKLPKDITEEHKDHWILHYPIQLCPENVLLNNNLYITPFDCRGIDFIKSILSQATRYIYISTESFTDKDFPNFLKKISLKNLEIKILTGAKSMDFTDRIQNTFRDLLAHNIKIRTREDDLHAKLIVTDKHIVISSINLNKMNLGFQPKKNFWRENTESITVDNDKDIVDLASKQFNEIFDESILIEKNITDKLKGSISNTIRSIFEIKSMKDEAKSSLANLILMKEIKTKKYLIDLTKSIYKISSHFKRNTISFNDFILGFLLYNISKKEIKYKELEEKINQLNITVDLPKLLSILIEERFIYKEGDYYKKIESS